MAREDAQMQYNLEVDRLKTQAAVVVAAVNRGLADHQDIEFLMSELRSVAKQLENASASAPGRKRRRTRALNARSARRRPGASGRPRPMTTSSKPRLSPTTSVTRRRGDAEPEPREEDLGR